jgi:hypothetical protein
MTTTTQTTTRWWSRTENLGGGATSRIRRIAYGPYLWDRTRNAVEVREYRGGGALTEGTDQFNPWRNPGPHAYINSQAADAHECRRAAQALIEAAEIIEGATR